MAVILAWGSMAWDSRRGDLIFWGGGHANYAGNEVYRWRSSSLLWERASLPSEVVRLASGQYETVDGIFNAPISAHTYDNSEYLPLIDRFVTFGGAAYNTGGPFILSDRSGLTGPYLWDPSRGNGEQVGGITGSHANPPMFPDVIGGQMWQNRNTLKPASALDRYPGDGQFGFGSATTGYVQENGKDVIYIGELGDLWRYVFNDVSDPTKDTYELAGIFWDAFSGIGAGGVDGARRLYVRTSQSGFTYWDLTSAGPFNRNWNFTPVDTSGSFPFDQLGEFGMDYDPLRHVFLLWNGDPDVWILTPPATASPYGWTLTKVPAPAGLPAPAKADGTPGFTGILGKWKYVADGDVFIGVLDPVAGDVWIYKPPASADDNPVPTVGSLSPSSATAGGPGFTLTVDGGRFVPSSVVVWNGETRSTTFVSATRLQASILASDVATAGWATVTVSNPAPGGGTAFGVSFAIGANKPMSDPPDLRLVATSVPTRATDHVPASFTFTVTNVGPVIATSTRIRYLVIDGVPISARSSRGSCAVRDVDDSLCSTGDLAPGDTAVVTVAVMPTGPGSMVQQVLAQSLDADAVPDDNTVLVITDVAAAVPLGITRRGSGHVTTAPDGIDCGGHCTAGFASGTVVVLEATPDPGWRFVGWTGAADCFDGAVVLHQALTCQATFVRAGDLAVTALSAPARIGAGQRVGINVTVRNLAGAPAQSGPFDIDFFLSPAATFDPAMARWLGTKHSSGLAGGAASTVSAAATAPLDAAAGPAYVIALLRAGALVNDPVENNNRRATPTTIVRSDLFITALVGPATVSAGTSVSLRTTVRNSAERVAVAPASTVGFYIAPGSAFDPALARRLGVASVPSLAGGASSVRSATLPIPGDLAPGQYVFAARADDLDAIAEADESNNWSAAVLVSVVSSDPAAVSVAGPAVAGAGRPAAVVVTVQNRAPSPGAAGPFTVGVYLSPTAQFSPATARRLGTINVAGLAAGATQRLSASPIVPADLEEGPYFFVANVDDAGRLLERSEDNNSVVALASTRVVRPDLAATAVSGPVSAAVGGKLAARVTVRNRALAPAAAGSFVVGVYLVAADDPAFVPVRVGGATVAGLAPAATTIATVMATLPVSLAAGAYRLFAVADDLTVVAEHDEMNNASPLSAPIQVVRPTRLAPMNSISSRERQLTLW